MDQASVDQYTAQQAAMDNYRRTMSQMFVAQQVEGSDFIRRVTRNGLMLSGCHPAMMTALMPADLTQDLAGKAAGEDARHWHHVRRKMN